jgi:ParB/RepB/Spo0J family partition protein
MGTMAAESSGTAQAMPVSMIEVDEPQRVINRLRDLKTSARDQLMIDPRIILVDDGQNPRNYNLPENRAHLDELKKSIRENGVLIPLLVRYDAERKAAVTVDGECRLRATLELIAEGVEIATVPTVQVPGNNEVERLITAITANTGKPLSKWELGGAFQRLYNKGLSPEQISARVGYTERFISEAMELSDAPDEIKQMLSSQAVTPSLALSELRANGAAAVDSLRAKAQSAKSSGQKTAKRTKAQPKNLKAKPAAPVSSVLPSAVVKAILAVVADVPADDLNLRENEWISVSRVKLLKLVSFAVTESDLKAAGVEAASF